MALNNLERIITRGASPLAMGTFFERDPQALLTLLQILSASQHLSDLLVSDPEGFDLLRLTEGEPVARASAGRRHHRRGIGPGARRGRLRAR